MRMTLGQYLPGDSIVHATDPRVKLFLMGFGIAAAFRVDTPLGLALFTLVCVTLGLLSKVPFGRLLKGLTPFIWLFAFTAVLHVFMTPGDAVAWLPQATWQGLHSGVKVGCQLVFAIWLSTLMTLTTSPLDMVWAMEWYMSPLRYLKVPVDEIALLIMLAIRFIPLLFEETDRILKAQKARGVDLESGGVMRKVKSLVPILVPLLHGVFRRADDLAVALTLRGYAPGIKRSRMKVMKAKPGDFASLAVTGLVFACLIWL